MGTVYFVTDVDFELFCKTHWVLCTKKVTNGYKCIVKE